jgi:hypothetical protein
MTDKELMATLKTTTEPAEGSRAAQPFRNPAYPQRNHFTERAHLEGVLQSFDQRLESASQKLNLLANHADKPRFLRLYHQLQGARDQVAETARRLPLEVGGLYHEDHERFEQAVEAFERTWRRWG